MTKKQELERLVLKKMQALGVGYPMIERVKNKHYKGYTATVSYEGYTVCGAGNTPLEARIALFKPCEEVYLKRRAERAEHQRQKDEALLLTRFAEIVQKGL